MLPEVGTPVLNKDMGQIVKVLRSVPRSRILEDGLVVQEWLVVVSLNGDTIPHNLGDSGVKGGVVIYVTDVSEIVPGVETPTWFAGGAELHLLEEGEYEESEDEDDDPD